MFGPTLTNLYWVMNLKFKPSESIMVTDIVGMRSIFSLYHLCKLQKGPFFIRKWLEMVRVVWSLSWIWLRVAISFARNSKCQGFIFIVFIFWSILQWNFVWVGISWGEFTHHSQLGQVPIVEQLHLPTLRAISTYLLIRITVWNVNFEPEFLTIINRTLSSLKVNKMTFPIKLQHFLNASLFERPL